jgi:hypothetical protein
VTKDVPAGEVWVGNPARKHAKHDWPSASLTDAEMDGWEEWFAASREVPPPPPPIPGIRSPETRYGLFGRWRERERATRDPTKPQRFA